MKAHAQKLLPSMEHSRGKAWASYPLQGETWSELDPLSTPGLVQTGLL